MPLVMVVSNVIELTPRINRRKFNSMLPECEYLATKVHAIQEIHERRLGAMNRAKKLEDEIEAWKARRALMLHNEL